MQFKVDGTLNLVQISRFIKPLDFYFALEKKYPEDDIVLVNAETFDEMRSAYRNYFSDAQQFVELIDHGVSKLLGNGAVA